MVKTSKLILIRLLPVLLITASAMAYVSDAKQPERLFRFLPIYTVVAGAIGFDIGWIVGRNV